MTTMDTDAKETVQTPDVAVRRVAMAQRPGISPALRARLMGIALLFVTLAVGGYWWGTRQSPLARLTSLVGSTERDTATAIAQWRPAAVDDGFFAGDGARTAASAEARFELLGGATLKLKPESLVRFHRSRAGAPLRVDVEMGEVDVQSGAGALTIDSEFGALVLDANSTVSLSRQGASLLVEVELGGIQVQQRAAAAGERLTLEMGGLVLDVAVPAPPTAAPEPTSAVVPPTPEPVWAVGDGVAHADLAIRAGATIVVHDPSPPTAVGVETAGVCDGPARLTSGKRMTEGLGQLNLQFTAGQNAYQVVCSSDPAKVVARGKVTVVRDTGTQRLPQFAPTANVVTDGRLYTVMYQHKLPNVSLSWPTAPSAPAYTLTVGGRTIQTKTPHHTLQGLAVGRHQVTFSAATSPVRSSRPTTVEVQRDVQAPTGEVADPPIDFAPSASVAVRGNALPGWSVSVEGRELTLDGQRSFQTQANGSRTIPIVFTHPNYGTHYYLRRPNTAR